MVTTWGLARSFPCLSHQRPVAIRTAVAEELPGIPHFGDHVEVEISYQHFVFAPAGLGDDLATRVAEVTLAVKLANIPGGFPADAIDGADEISVGNGVRRLL